MTAVNLDRVVDDRQGQRAGRRAEVDRLLALAEHLPADERLLVEAVYERGESMKNLAAMAGCPRHRLQKRLSRALRRMQSPLFRFCCQQMDLLPPSQQRIARLHVLHGRSLRDTASLTNFSLHHVRQARSALLTLARASGFNIS